MEAISFNCQRLLLYRRALIMVLNDPDISDNGRFLYAVMFAHRAAETTVEIRQIFESVNFLDFF